jgi:23S rRNA pseudouridine1911/1915/1917 synthase
LQILLETNHFLALNKPSGIIVEKNPYEPSVEDWAWEYLQKTTKKPYLGIIHRLDRVTSGVLLLAKKKSFLKALNEQFRLRKVQKTYQAVVENKPELSAANLVHFLAKDQQNKRAIILENAEKGAQEVKLHYRILKEINGQFLLEIHPKTGKFHQIRAQLAAIGCPILNDEKYGAELIADKRTIALHAAQLTFIHPISNEKIYIKADYSSSFFQKF